MSDFHGFDAANLMSNIKSLQFASNLQRFCVACAVVEMCQPFSAQKLHQNLKTLRRHFSYTKHSNPYGSVQPYWCFLT